MFKIKTALDELKIPDIYSLLLFIVFKLKELPEQSTLSELVYLLDQNSLLKLCEYYGGMTIQIPTIHELETLIYALVVYQKVNIENNPFEDVIKEIKNKSTSVSEVEYNYVKICSILENYNFNAGDSNV